MMETEELLSVLRQLSDTINADGCKGSCCDDCTTVRSFEQTAARANDQAAFAAAESQKSFVQLQNTFFAQLLKQQAPT